MIMLQLASQKIPGYKDRAAGELIFLNPSHVSTVSNDMDDIGEMTTCITLTNGHALFVDDERDDVVEMIEETLGEVEK